MSSPLQRKAKQLRAADALPDSNWLQRRQEAIKQHVPSIENGLAVVRDMSEMILNGRISNDLRYEQRLDIDKVRPGDELGYLACSLIPSLSIPQNIPVGRGQSWTPDVAFQLTFSFQDEYLSVPSQVGRKPQPQGDVSLHVHARTWGRVSQKEADDIAELGQNSWAQYGDNGHSRKGTAVVAVLKPGEQMSRDAAETMLAPLASHIVDYFELTGKTDFAAYQRPGNYTRADGREFPGGDMATPSSDLQMLLSSPKRLES